MIRLTQTIHAFGTPEFKAVVKNEIQNISPALLPLQQGLSVSSYVGASPFSVIILNVNEEANTILVKAGIFYTGIIAGCSCSDDPSPTDEQTEYCELQFAINKKTAGSAVKLLNQ
jgi:hypothetical protein